MTQRLVDILKEAESLSADEQMVLIVRLAERNRAALTKGNGRRSWRGIRGLARPSLLGKDAQVWVNRSRRESDRSGRRASGA